MPQISYIWLSNHRKATVCSTACPGWLQRKYTNSLVGDMVTCNKLFLILWDHPYRVFCMCESAIWTILFCSIVPQCRHKSPATWWFVPHLVHINSKDNIKAPHYWPFGSGISRGQRIFSTEIQSKSSGWCHNERDGISNHQPHDCLLKRLCRRKWKKTLKLRITGLCVGNSPVSGEFPTQRVSNAEYVSNCWCHHGFHTMTAPCINSCGLCPSVAIWL